MSEQNHKQEATMRGIARPSSGGWRPGVALMALAVAIGLSTARGGLAQEGMPPGGDGAGGSAGAPPTPEPLEPAEPERPEMPPPPVGGSGFDMEAYARGLFDAAQASSQAGDHAKAASYCRYLKLELGQSRFSKSHAGQIDELLKASEDAQAQAHFAKAAELAEKNPARAKESLTALRTKFGGTRFLVEKRAEVEALEAKVRTALWEGKGAYRGTAFLPREGVLRLTYELDRVEELGDFTSAGKTPPRVDGGRLTLQKADGVVRHRLDVPAGATYAAEVEARGVGKMTLVLEGDATAAPASGAAAPLTLELDAGDKALKLTLAKGDAAGDRQEVAEARAGGAAAGFRVRVERLQGRVRASVLRAVPATATAPESVTVGATVTRGPTATEMLAAPLGSALRVGLLWTAGKVEVERLVVEGPLPSGVVAAAGKNGAKAPLPKGVWIPLAKHGADDWKAQGKWSFEKEVVKQESDPASLVHKDLEGRKLVKYAFTVDVRVVRDDAKRARREPYLAIALPVGETGFAWVLSSRDMRLDGAENAHLLATLPPAQWVTLSVKVDAKVVEAYLGDKKVLSAPSDSISGGRFFARAEGVAFRALPGPERVELRAPKIRVEQEEP